MLARVVRRHRHAVQLDVLRLGYRTADMFTKLTVDEMISIVAAADPNSAVYHAVNGGFTVTDHLLATLYEHQAGLAHLSTRIARPGVTDIRPAKLPDIRDPKTKRVTFDSMTIDEYEALRNARLKGA